MTHLVVISLTVTDSPCDYITLTVTVVQLTHLVICIWHIILRAMYLLTYLIVRANILTTAVYFLVALIMLKHHSDSESGNPCRHIGYSFGLTARVILYELSHRQDNTFHGLCYTCRGALTGKRNSSLSPPHEGSIRRPIAPWANGLTTELRLVPSQYRGNVTNHGNHLLNVHLEWSSRRW